MVEVLVSGVLSVVISSSILSLLYFNNAQIREVLAEQKLQQAYEIASEAIHRSAKSAYTVRGDDETWPTTSPLNSPIPTGSLPTAKTSMSKIVFYNKANSIIGGFRVNSEGFLVEILAGGSEQEFLVGGLRLTPLNPNKFTISAERKSIQFQMDISMSIDGQVYELASPREIVLCRNNDYDYP